MNNNTYLGVAQIQNRVLLEPVREFPDGKMHVVLVASNVLQQTA